MDPSISAQRQQGSTCVFPRVLEMIVFVDGSECVRAWRINVYACSIKNCDNMFTRWKEGGGGGDGTGQGRAFGVEA